MGALEVEREATIKYIREEREKQIKQYGLRTEVNLEYWIPLLCEEMGEIARETLNIREIIPSEYGKERINQIKEDMYWESVQAAALLLAMAERLLHDLRMDGYEINE